MATARMPIRMEIGNHGPIEVGEVEFPARRGELGFVLDFPSVAAALRAAADRLDPHPAPVAELTEARCWSCDHLAADHQSDGCHHPITCALVSVETADFDALCSCAVSAESAVSWPEPTATPEQDGGQAEPTPLLMRDCHNGKHGSCLGDPCECPCHGEQAEGGL